MNINDEIRQANLERIKSIEFLFLEKSMSDDLQYGIKPDSNNSNISSISVSKTGEDIKGKLIQELQNISSCKQDNYNKMIILAKQISVNPIKELDSYRAKDWKGKVQVPLIYCYSQIFDETSNQDVPEAKIMRDYNHLARDYFDKSIEEKKINTIINAIDSKRKYKLTIELASKLGF